MNLFGAALDTEARADAAAAQGDATQALADAATAQGDATQALADAATAQGDIDTHAGLTNNPHAVTAPQAGAIPTTDRNVANGVAPLDAAVRLPEANLPLAIGAQWFGVGPSAMAAIRTNTNGEAGTWATPTLPGAILPGLGVGNALFLGFDTANPAGALIDITTALSGGAYSVTYWTGAWTARPYMVTTHGAPHTKRLQAGLRNVEAQAWRFGAVSDAVQKALDGATKYWIKIEVTSGLSVAPIAASVQTVGNSMRLHADGVRTYFGDARPEFRVIAHQKIWTPQTGSAPGSTDVLASANITINPSQNSFADGGLNSLIIWFRHWLQMDVSDPVDLVILWQNNTAATAPNNTVQWVVTHAHLTEGSSVLDGTISDDTQTLQETVPNVAKRLNRTVVPLQFDDATTDGSLPVKVTRDARPANGADLYGNYALFLHSYLDAKAWRD